MYKDIIKVKNDVVYIDEMKVEDLVKIYNTPLIIYHQTMLENNIKMLKETFTSQAFDCQVLYASKAFSIKALYQLLNKYHLGCDVVSGGELYSAIDANFDSNNIFFHGNNKSYEELELAINHNVGCIVIDNISEIELLKKICRAKQKQVKVMLRLNPGINAHTHAYIHTAKLTSKFGISIFNIEAVVSAINQIKACKYLSFMGLHCHIGSQIFDKRAHIKASKVLIDFMVLLKAYDIDVKWLNLGGGFGVSINSDDTPYDLKDMLSELIKRVENHLKRVKLKIEKLIIEPGRFIVSECGATIYRIGGVKDTYANKKYVVVDGGMGDNIRPALYGAKYECDIINKINLKKEHVYAVAGKNCESGDILIQQTLLPTPSNDDLLIIYSTGAYTYAMSSNYNRTLKPAIIFVKQGKAKLVVKRQTYEDLVRSDLPLED